VRRIAEAFCGSEFAVGSLLINDAGGAMPWVYIASQKPPLLAMHYLQATPPRRGCLVVIVFRKISAVTYARVSSSPARMVSIFWARARSRSVTQPWSWLVRWMRT
jgi:hypothetical protein